MFISPAQADLRLIVAVFSAISFHLLSFLLSGMAALKFEMSRMLVFEAPHKNKHFRLP
jgi:hypothetical protein